MTATRFTVEIVVVVPLGRMEDLALERSIPGREGTDGSLSGPGAATSIAGREGPAGGVDPPQLRVLVPGRTGHGVAEAQVGHDPGVLGAAAQVGLDLRLARERAAPGRVGREGERVQVRRDVALAARVMVVAPRAADVVGALEHDEVVDALLLEADRHAEAGEAAADDGHVHVARRGVLPGRLRGCRSGRVSLERLGGRHLVHLPWAQTVDFGSIRDGSRLLNLSQERVTLATE